jgi:hypothetical protein
VEKKMRGDCRIVFYDVSAVLNDIFEYDSFPFFFFFIVKKKKQKNNTFLKDIEVDMNEITSNTGVNNVVKIVLCFVLMFEA